jgi:RNA polymerase sigma-32 factor
VRLVSFAVHWIKAEIHDFVLRNWRIVKVATTKAQRKLFFNLRRSKRRLGWFSHAEVKAVADDLGVPTEAVLEMESRLSGQDVSLDPTPQYGTDDDESVAPISYLADDSSNDPAQLLEQADWAHQTHQGLTAAMNSLDARSRDILQRRWLSDAKPTLHQLAVEYGVSAERIRQIENGAIKKLKVQLAA